MRLLLAPFPLFRGGYYRPSVTSRTKRAAYTTVAARSSPPSGSGVGSKNPDTLTTIYGKEWTGAVLCPESSSIP